MRTIRRFVFLILAISSLGLGSFFGLNLSAQGTVHVRGYYRANGTYVAPYNRTAPNSTKDDNWSTKGNVNPYTGAVGTKNGDADTSGIATAPPGTAVVFDPSAPVTPLPPSTVVVATPPEPPTVQQLFVEIRRLSEQVRALETELRALQATSSYTNGLSPTLAAWRRLKSNMTPDEVKAVLGEPTRVADQYWYYPNYGKITFIADLVFQWEEPVFAKP